VDDKINFTHLGEDGRAHMVDVGRKKETHRRAVAKARVIASSDTIEALSSGKISKGDVLAVAQLAGIQAAKRTSDLIPLCHPLILSAVDVDLSVDTNCVQITASVENFGRTGVEMEALTACAVTALTIYDMCKSFDRSMTIEQLGLVEKVGGKSGHWKRES
tara:strand:- start:71 stop:553 length:483 start_codon:yes stop_codon:yes gene_type:complete